MRCRLFPLVFVLIALLSSCSPKEVADVKKEATCMEDLKGCKVAAILGSVQDIKLSSYPEIEVERVNDASEIILSVQSGVSDYGVVESAVLAGLDLKEKNLKVNFLSEEVQSSALAFRKDDTALCEEFNAFLSRLRENGTLDDMAARWTTPPVDASAMPVIEIPANSSKKLVVGTLSGDFPFSYIDNSKLVGYEIEMFDRFCADAGYQVEYKRFNFASLISALVSGKIDVIMALMSVTEERSKQVLFSDSYFNTAHAFFSLDKEAVADSQSLWSLIKTSFTDNLISDRRWKLILDGLWETVIISFFAVILGTIFGFLLCRMALSRRKWLNACAKVYSSIMSGVPMLVFLMFMFYVVFISSRMTATWVAIIAFALNFAAPVGSLFASNVRGIDKGQNEAGRALGLSNMQTFIHIIAPQALRRSISVYKGNVISLVKSTSIVGYIAIMDLTKASDIIRSRTFDAFFPLIIISVVYFIIAYLIGKALDLVDRKTTPKSRKI